MRAWLAAGVALAPACREQCGTYTYKGVQGVEHCGQVWGTEATVSETGDDPEQAWAEITFRHLAPPGEFDFDHQGGVTARVRWSDLISGDELGPDTVLTACDWIDRNQPLYDPDDVQRLEPATEVRLRDHGRRPNLDVGNTYVRDLSWEIVCGDGVIRLDAKDNVKFARTEGGGLPPDLAEHLGLAEP